MSGINNPQNIIGIADILADQDIDLDLDSIEKSIITGTTIVPEDDTKPDYTKEYTKEIDMLTKTYGLDQSKPTSVRNDTQHNTQYNTQHNTHNDIFSSPFVDKPKEEPRSIPTNTKLEAPSYLTKEESDTSDSESDGSNVYQAPQQQSQQYNFNNQYQVKKPRDRQMRQITHEERMEKNLDQVLGVPEHTTTDKFLDAEDEEDEMLEIIVQIDNLRSNLESDGVNLERIPEITPSSSMKEAQSVLKILQIKNDRLRYCDMFEEGILAVAYGLESVFDGKREMFGTKIDLVGWPETVKVKLRRMRYNTSSFVSNVMKGYAIGHGWRIVLELIPSLFLYSRDRRIRTNDNLVSDAKYTDALNELNN